MPSLHRSPRPGRDFPSDMPRVVQIQAQGSSDQSSHHHRARSECRRTGSKPSIRTASARWFDGIYSIFVGTSPLPARRVVSSGTPRRWTSRGAPTRWIGTPSVRFSPPSGVRSRVTDDDRMTAGVEVQLSCRPRSTLAAHRPLHVATNLLAGGRHPVACTAAPPLGDPPPTSMSTPAVAHGLVHAHQASPDAAHHRRRGSGKPRPPGQPGDESDGHLSVGHRARVASGP